jgi:hypothetical protein
MKTFSMVVAIAAFLTGVAAAWYWYHSAKVDPKTGWKPPVGDATQDPNALLANLNALFVWTFAIKDALRESSRLNRSAAIWTAISVLLSAVAAVMGNLPSN